MIGRRNLMAMIGLAPVAAVSPSAAPTTDPYQSALFPAADLMPLDYARGRAAALSYARANNIKPLDGPLIISDVADQEVSAMRSWSPQFRHRVASQRRGQRYQENRMAEALANVEREIKLSMAPQWMRRFL